MEESTGSLNLEPSRNKSDNKKEKEHKKPQSLVIEPTRYRLNVYNHSGTLKNSIPVAVFQDMSIRYGDIMRAVSATRWMTMDEICDASWQIEKKMKYPSNRTRKAIEIAIFDLIERSMIITK